MSRLLVPHHASDQRSAVQDVRLAHPKHAELPAHLWQLRLRLITPRWKDNRGIAALRKLRPLGKHNIFTTRAFNS